MNRLKSAYGFRLLITTFAGLILASLLSLTAGGTASATPLAPSGAVVAQAVAPSSVISTSGTTTKYSTHCGVKLRWKTALSAHDSDVRFKVWVYTSKAKAHIRSFCFRMYRQVSGDTTVMGAIVKTYKGVMAEGLTQDPTFTVYAKMPAKKKMYLTPEYGNRLYGRITFKGYGAK